MKKIIFLDVEADSLTPTVIHCVCGLIDGKEFWTAHPKELQEYIKGGNIIVGHNILGYDKPVLERLWNIDFEGCFLVDTLVMSRIAEPCREGGHSLRNWGEYLRMPKAVHEDFEEFSEEMLAYCQQDVRLTKAVYDRLLLDLEDFSDESIQLEHEVQRIILDQMDSGWLLDQEKTFMLLAELKEKKNDIEEEVRTTFKPLPSFIREVTPRIKKDGSLSIVGLRFLGSLWESVGGDFSRIDWEEFNLGSRQQIAKQLQYFGWKPDQFTATGQPVINEKVLASIKNIPEASLISEYLMIQKRIAQVQSWQDAVQDDGRVHGYVNANGTVTGRMTHSSPNMGQIPAIYSPYGAECRRCWIVPNGYKLVGVDASGLELRMLAHYMNDKEFTNEILTGDIHTRNQRLAGLGTRDQAKTFIYAFLYGAGDEKIGSIVGGNSTDGRDLKRKFLKNTPALARLREAVGRASTRGFLYGLDRRRIAVRSEHSALNTLLQSAGSIVMKHALRLLENTAILPFWNDEPWEYRFIGNIHDEIQTEVKENQAEKFGQMAVDCLEETGKQLKLKCPLTGDYKVGDNWAETH